MHGKPRCIYSSFVHAATITHERREPINGQFEIQISYRQQQTVSVQCVGGYVKNVELASRQFSGKQLYFIDISNVIKF